MTTTPAPFPLMGEMLALSCAVLWAYAVILFRKSAVSLDPLAMNLFKSVLIAPLILAAALLWGDLGTLSSATRTDVILMTVSAVLGLYIADTMLFLSLKMIGASIPFITSCLYAPAVMLGASLFLSEKLTVFSIVGAGIIVAGILLVSTDKFYINEGVSKKTLVLGTLIAAGNSLMAAAGTVMIKIPLEHLGVFEVTFFRMIIGLIPLILHVHLAGMWSEVRKTFSPSPAWRYLIPASVIGTYISMLMWVAGIKYADAHTASILNQTSPIFGIVFAAVLLDEKLSVRKLAGVTAAFGGIVLVFLG